MIQGLRSGWCARRFVAALGCMLMALVLFGCGSAKLAGGPPMAPEPPEEPGAAEGVATSGSLYAEADEAARPREAMAQAASPAPAPERAMPEKKPAPADRNDAGQTAPAQPDTGVATGSEPKLAGPMLIYRATLNMAVFETRKAIDAVEKLAKDSGGYLVSREDQRITIRVPARKFDGTLDQIAKLGDLLHRNVNVQDVTAEYTDLAIRMRNLEVMRERLEILLKKADKVEDALAVERELERVTSEIERLKGRLKLLQELVSFSTITVEFQPRPVDHIDSKVTLPFPWLNQLGLGDLLRL